MNRTEREFANFIATIDSTNFYDNYYSLNAMLDKEYSNIQDAERAKKNRLHLRSRDKIETNKKLIEGIVNSYISVDQVVKVKGNSTLSLRKIESIDFDTKRFTGRHCKFDKNGDLEMGSYITEHMFDKVTHILDGSDLIKIKAYKDRNGRSQ